METNANQKVTCIANYAYEASEPDELTIRPGEVLREVERLPGGWWRGELRGRRGMFPDNFVSVTTEPAARTSTGVSGRCRAVFSYQPANPDELPLSVGDVLDVLGEVEEGWWQGRRQGRVGVFPSNFVVMLDPQPPPYEPVFEPAPALPPKPVKELCRVLFPYTAVNEDELTLAEGDVVCVVSKEAPDRGWWRGELHGRVGLFPDNFVQLLPPVTHETMEEKKPDRPPSKNSIYPVLNKYSEKTASVKELTTSKISTHKENTLSKENNTTSTITHTNKIESEKIIHNESVTDGTPDSQGKKPPVPLKKSPTPTSGVTSLFSGLKNKMLSTDKTDKEKEKSSTTMSSGSSSGGEWDRPDGGAGSKPANNNNNNNNTFDHVERHSILNDPRAGRVKAPRRRPPSQALRDDTPQQIGLSNGHEVPGEISVPSEKPEEIKPRAREWEKNRVPWMEELKLNQAKKTSFDGGKRPDQLGKNTGSTDRILDVGLEEKRSSSHSMEMSKSTSSISSRMSVLESFEETSVRHSADNKTAPREPEPAARPVHSPTAAGRTLLAMLDDIKKPLAPVPAPAPAPAPAASARGADSRSGHIDIQKTTLTSEKNEMSSTKSGIFEKSTVERLERTEEKVEKEKPVVVEKATTLERRPRERSDSETLIAQLNNRISNLEKLLEVQNAKFNAAIEELATKLAAESEKRLALQSELHKLAHCVTQV